MFKLLIFIFVLLPQISKIFGNDNISLGLEIQRINMRIDSFERSQHDSQLMDIKLSIQNLTFSIERRLDVSELRNEARFNHLEQKFDNLSLEFKGISFWQTYFIAPTWLLLTLIFPTLVKYIWNTEFFKMLLLYIIPNRVINNGGANNQNEEKKQD